MDNYGTHKEPHVQAWLKKHPRFVCHFVPTSSSWLNLVERWFRELTEKAIRRGSFVSVPELKQAIEGFMQAWNESPKPFIWSATVEDIIKKIDRARVKMEQIKPGSTQPRGKRRRLFCKVINGTYHQSSIVLFERIHGVLDVFGCDDCVAYEDRTGLPATNLHSDRLWHPGVNQITGTRTTQVSNMPGHWHAKGDSFFPFAHLPFPFEPSVVGVEWSGLQVSVGALFERKRGVSEAECERRCPSGWRLFHFQYSRSPLRCQGMTVSGLTMTNADRQPLQNRASHTHRNRSARLKRSRWPRLECWSTKS